MKRTRFAIQLVTALPSLPLITRRSTAANVEHGRGSALRPGTGAQAGRRCGPLSTVGDTRVTMIDGAGGPPRGPVDITIEGHRIANIRSAGTPGVPLQPDRAPS